MTLRTKPKTIYINMYNPESLEESVNKLQREISKINNNIELSKRMKVIENLLDDNYSFNDNVLNENVLNENQFI